MEIETRITDPVKAELRVKQSDDGGPGTVEGHAAVFNSDSRMMVTKTGRRFIERVLPGSFAKIIKSQNETKALVDHDESKLLARRTKGTLSMREDAKGLAVEIALPKTTLGSDTAENVRSGNLDRMSFAFATGEGDDSWERRNDGTYLRTVKNVSRLDDVTLTDDRAAYPATDLYLRMADEAIDKLGVDGGVISLDEARLIEAQARNVHDIARAFHVPENQLRAIMSVEDPSLIWVCRSAVQYFRCGFDACNSIIDTCGRVEGDLSDDDTRAMDDAYDELVDLIAKARTAKAALESLGAQEEEDAGDSSVMDEAAANTVRAKLEQGTITAAEAKSTLAEIERRAAEMRRLKKVAGGRYVVMSEDGAKQLSKPMGRAQAMQRLKEIEHFKQDDKKDAA